MCGVVGVVAQTEVNLMLFDALTVLQHRGQDAAGITTSNDGWFCQKKANGLVRDVFDEGAMGELKGNMGIAHVRYPTAGSSGPELAQPFYVNSPYGISLAHNGNLTNTRVLSEQLFKEDLRHLNTDSDSEVLLNIFAHDLQYLNKLVPSKDDFFKAAEGVYRRCRGGFAVVAMIAGFGILAFRDPNGIRPLIYGSREVNGKMEYMVASESVALSALGFKVERDIAPGEAVFMSHEGEIFFHQCAPRAQLRPCIFEHVYFARPDSIMDKVSVYKARLRQGERLAQKILREHPDHDIDVVIPIPDTSRVAAQSMAQVLGVKFREGLMKNRYIGRTFIMPGQEERKKSVRRKLNAIDLEFKGKNVMLVDDSIVRGTTCRQIIEMAREAGAKNVYFASACPPVRYPNVYGIDMPTSAELIANSRTVDEVAQEISADWLIYQDLDDLIESSREGNTDITEFDTSVFTGSYITGDVDQQYLDQMHQERNDESKKQRFKNRAGA